MNEVHTNKSFVMKGLKLNLFITLDDLIYYDKDRFRITFCYEKTLDEPIVLKPTYSKYKVKMLDHQLFRRDWGIEYDCKIFFNTLQNDSTKVFSFGSKLFSNKKYDIPPITINSINVEITLSYLIDLSDSCIENSLLDNMNFEMEIVEKKLKIPKIVITPPDELCCICLNQTYNFTKCIHYVCENCLKEWLNIDTTCPMCRDKLYYISIDN
jgi:hypothetical protein